VNSKHSNNIAYFNLEISFRIEAKGVQEETSTWKDVHSARDDKTPVLILC